MAHTITIDAQADALNQFVTRFDKKIHQEMRQALEWEKILKPVLCDHSYTSPNVAMVGGIQPYQVGFTPNNEETFGEVTNILQPIKVDMEFTEEQLNKFFAAWKAEWFQSGKDETIWTYPKYILDTVVKPLILEQLNAAAWAGEYTAPTAGAAGAYLESVDGFKKKIEDAITASKITPITTGAPAVADMVPWFEGFVDSLPEVMKSKGGIIIASKKNARDYLRDWREEYGYHAGNQNNNNEKLGIFAHDIEVVPMASMGASNRLIFVPKGTDNMIFGSRDGYPMYPKFLFKADVRSLKVYATIYRFFGFRYWENLRVNDQE